MSQLTKTLRRAGVVGSLLVVTWCADGRLLGNDHAAKLRVRTDAVRPQVCEISWDTEGGTRAKENLLRQNSAVRLRFRMDGRWTDGINLDTKAVALEVGGARYEMQVSRGAAILWTVRPGRDRLEMNIEGRGTCRASIQAIELVFPFSTAVTPTTVLPSRWLDDGSLRLPAVISAPDFGQMRLEEGTGRRLRARLEGSRKDHEVFFRIEVPVPADGGHITLKLSPLLLPAPEGLQDTRRWRLARRGWFGAIQPTSRWGELGRPYSAPPGVLGNNVVSDPASCSLWFYADQILWTPKIASDISLAPLLRRSLDYWLLTKTKANGEVIGYWAYTGFLDANASPLIAAWDYVEVSEDEAWLAKRIVQLERIAGFLARRDVDNDGLVEARQSGNYGALVQPGRSCAWWDAINCGHKDAYTNAIIYRAWRCLAELEGRLGRVTQRNRYAELADRLQASYFDTFFNIRTGWLAWWKSEDGQLHDYASPVVNGIAIEYGLVKADRGRQILQRLWDKIAKVGFKRFDLGVPCTLVPVRQDDYLGPQAIGRPTRADGSDTLGQYMNGGVTAGQVLHFLAAHYAVGWPEPADRLLDAMLGRQQNGSFQCGVTNRAMAGIDWTDWQGRPTGYEGYLADSFRFLQAVLLREKPFRDRYYRPLRARAE